MKNKPHLRKVEKNDLLIKYSDTCKLCLSGFKEGQEIVIDGIDHIHKMCWDEKHGN
jgi:hypothetical protein